jgi:hypothetical protein
MTTLIIDEFIEPVLLPIVVRYWLSEKLSFFAVQGFLHFSASLDSA